MSQARRERQGETERENRHLFVDFGEMHVEDGHRYIKKMCPKMNCRVAHTSGSLHGLSVEEGLYCECAPPFSRDRFELKLATPEGKQVVLYPDKDEPKHILNIKRGIISALLVPPETEEDKQVLLLVRSLKANDSGLAKSSSYVRGHVVP